MGIRAARPGPMFFQPDRIETEKIEPLLANFRRDWAARKTWSNSEASPSPNFSHFPARFRDRNPKNRATPIPKVLKNDLFLVLEIEDLVSQFAEIFFQNHRDKIQTMK